MNGRRQRGSRAGLLVLLGYLLLAAGCTTVTENPAGEMDGIHLDLIELPPGFLIELVTDDLKGARSLAMSPGGVLYVGTRGSGVVYAVTGLETDDSPVGVHTIDSGLDVPNGVAWRDGDLYVAEKSRILRYDDIDERIDDPPEPTTVRDAFPQDDLHGWKFIPFGPDGALHVPVGAPCNVCESDDPIYGSINRLDVSTGVMETFATGVRNTLGFDWHPQTEELWFTDNGADLMGDDRPYDELNRAASPGLDFGFPYCHGGDLPDPQLGDEGSCQRSTPPAIQLAPHAAALGMRFYDSDLFPPEYRGQIFVAEHGSWNRSDLVGYRITSVQVVDNAATKYEPFAEGWLQGEAAWGRPVDLEIALDGSLLVSDDEAGAVYRISYQPSP